MRIRQFTAPTTAAALRELRDTLGEDALVLSTRSEPGGVVITAAVDAGDAPESAASAAHAEPAWAGSDGRDDDLRFDVALIRTRLEQLGRKVHRMDRSLLEIGSGVAALGADAREIAERLVASGLGLHLAQPVAQAFERELAQARPHAEALRASLLEHVAVAAPGAPRVEALIGPTGSGKTTTIAKLAAYRVRAGEATPVLVLADNHRIGAAAELGCYARLFGASLHVVRDAQEMRAVLDTLGDAERVLIDTAGLCGDAAGGAELQALLAAAGDDLAVTAVVSATASASALQRIWPQLAHLGAQRCVVTRADECDEPGIACTWLAEVGLPLAWLGTGRRVPDDLVAASGDDLVRWLMAA